MTSLSLPETFAAKMGRPLRVLHLGNVANYAYVNAKLMRRAGVEADVIDPDFYHIMATPEWHEATIDGYHGNDWFPRWSQVNLNGYQRPDWVVQGRSDLAWAVLGHKAAGNRRGEAKARRRMAFESKLVAQEFTGIAGWFWNTKVAPIRLIRGPFRRLQGYLDRRAAPQRPPERDDDPSLVADVAGRPYLADYRLSRNMVRAALDYYDIVIGYTVSGIVAATSGYERLIAYELGTLRGLPWADSDLGRLTSWLYLHAPEVFVTNVDCMVHAQNLGIAAERTTPVLHAYDLEHIIAQSDQFQAKKHDGPPMFFAPARHHWHKGNSSWLKGNDVYLRALGTLARAGYDFQLVTVEWGEEVNLSKQLIEDEGFSEKVVWCKPMSRVAACAYYAASVGVIDQFNAAAFGGVALDAMAAGRRLITRYDGQAASAFFDSMPQIENCAHHDDVVVALKAILNDPDDRASKGAKLRDWMREEHGAERQLSRQFAAMARLLERFPVSI
jgi:glycosyltransferase involved in cell wall biosynthesis